MTDEAGIKNAAARLVGDLAELQTPAGTMLDIIARDGHGGAQRVRVQQGLLEEIARAVLDGAGHQCPTLDELIERL